MAQKKLIIDVSRYNGEIDWARVAAMGYVDGVMLKTVSTNRNLSKRKDGLYVDPYFERNYAACVEHGIPVGVYYYTYATSQAMADAELALLREALRGKTLTMPVAVDVEDNKLIKLSRAALTDLVYHAARTIESWGLYAMVYTYTSYSKAELDMARLKPFDIWLADYTGKDPKVSFAYSMHQFTDAGRVTGVTGNVDISRTAIDYPGVIKRYGLGRIKAGGGDP